MMVKKKKKNKDRKEHDWILIMAIATRSYFYQFENLAKVLTKMLSNKIREDLNVRSIQKTLGIQEWTFIESMKKHVITC